VHTTRIVTYPVPLDESQCQMLGVPYNVERRKPRRDSGALGDNMSKKEKTIEEATSETVANLFPSFEKHGGPVSPSILIGATPQDVRTLSVCCRGALRFPSADESEKYGGRLMCRVCGSPQD
jgi:hypothetical protein